MAEFPTYVKVLYSGYSEGFDPSIERTEMERGVPKQRLLNSQVLMKLRASLLFRSEEQIDAFERWYFVDIARIGWFAMRHPRTRAFITARFEEAKIGDLSPNAPGFWLAQRDVVLEYVR